MFANNIITVIIFDILIQYFDSFISSSVILYYFITLSTKWSDILYQSTGIDAAIIPYGKLNGNKGIF